MIIEIDNREPTIIKEFFKKISSNDIKINYKNLEQGDFIVKDSNENIIIIVERKTIDDLLSSVKDNRYKEQSDRFLELDISSNKIYYIVEGNFNIYNSESIEYKTIYSCIYSLSYNKGFSLLFTNSIKETCLIIYEFLIRFVENKISSNNKINLVKKNLITKDNIDFYMLNLVPGIGLITAKEILFNYNNKIYILIETLKKDENCLNCIKIKNRKLNKKIIENIKLYLVK